MVSYIIVALIIIFGLWYFKKDNYKNVPIPSKQSKKKTTGSNILAFLFEILVEAFV